MSHVLLFVVSKVLRASIKQAVFQVKFPQMPKAALFHKKVGAKKVKQAGKLIYKYLEKSVKKFIKPDS